MSKTAKSKTGEAQKSTKDLPRISPEEALRIALSTPPPTGMPAVFRAVDR